MGWLARFALAVTVLSLAGGPWLAPVLSGVALAQSDDRSRSSDSDAGSGSRGSEGGGSSREGGDEDNETGGRGNSDPSDGGARGPSGGQDGSGAGGSADGSDPGEGEAASGKGNARSGQEADGSDSGEGGPDPSDGGDDRGSSGLGDNGEAVESHDASSEEGGASDGGERGSTENSEDDVGAGSDRQEESSSGEDGPAEDGSGTGGSGSFGDAAEGSSDVAGEGAPDEGVEGSPGAAEGGSSANGGDEEGGDTADEDTAGDLEDDGPETPAAPSVPTRVDDPSPAPQEEERPTAGVPVTAVDPGAPGPERPGKNGAPEDDPEPETQVPNGVHVVSGAAPATGTGSGRARRSLPDILGAVLGGKQRTARAPVADPLAEPSSAVAPEPVQAVVPGATSAPRTKAKEPPSAARAPRIELSSGDRAGNYRRYEITALGLTPQARQVVGALGFRVLSERRSPLLGNQIVAKLRTPGGQTATAALGRVRGLLPEVVFDYAHIYRPSGEQVAVRYPTEMIGGPGAGGCRLEIRIGLIDSGVGTHASLAEAGVVRKSFLERRAATNVAHGTAIASILVGDLPGAGPLVPGAKLFAANVFAQDESGPRADATAIIAALDWMAEQRVPVVNLSLMGPSNVLLEAAVQAAAERGQILVAAAGNDGPGGAPAYPAAYPGVIAVAALDARGRPYGRNNRGPYIYVAAPGVDIWGADARGGEAFWTGTSFAAPFVTAALARDIAEHRVSNVNDGRARIAANARDLGAPGRDPIFGHGLLQAGGCGGDAVMSSRD